MYASTDPTREKKKVRRWPNIKYWIFFCLLYIFRSILSGLKERTRTRESEREKGKNVDHKKGPTQQFARVFTLTFRCGFTSRPILSAHFICIKFILKRNSEVCFTPVRTYCCCCCCFHLCMGYRWLFKMERVVGFGM